MSEPQLAASDAVDRVVALTDKDENVESVVRVGENEHIWFHVAIMQREYKGKQYLNERYVALAKPGANAEDTFMKNGINRRDDEGSLARRLAQAYMAIANRQDADEDDYPVLYKGGD